MFIDREDALVIMFDSEGVVFSTLLFAINIESFQDFELELFCIQVITVFCNLRLHFIFIPSS